MPTIIIIIITTTDFSAAKTGVTSASCSEFRSVPGVPPAARYFLYFRPDQHCLYHLRTRLAPGIFTGVPPAKLGRPGFHVGRSHVGFLQDCQEDSGRPLRLVTRRLAACWHFGVQ